MSTNRLRHFIKVRGQQVMRNNVAELAEPKPRQCRQYFALSFDWCGRNAVESRDAIGRDNQKSICIDFVNITNFATPKKFEIREGSFNYWSHCGHANDPKRKSFCEAPSSSFVHMLSRMPSK